MCSRGHGTYIHDGNLVATVSGIVDRVNKLVSVLPLKSRYVDSVSYTAGVVPKQSTSRFQGEIGDVVVGRIVEVAHKRWKVDIQGRQHALLMLSSINLPGGAQVLRALGSYARQSAKLMPEQRRRSAADALQMRNFFAEGDLISVCVSHSLMESVVTCSTNRPRYSSSFTTVRCRSTPAIANTANLRMVSL